MTGSAKATPQDEYEVGTAEKLWSILSPERYLFSPRERTVFRGQSNAGWDLIPSILREQNHPLKSIATFRLSTASDLKIFAEIHSLKVFAEYCDTAGLRLPVDSTSFRRDFLNPLQVMDSFILQRKLWPSREYYDLMAVAQHHGLPTRLLDWTRSAYVAAFFAASGALKANPEPTHFAVWALDTEQFQPGVDLEFIRVPGGNNANVAAQAGLFTLLKQSYSRGQDFQGPSSVREYIRSLGLPRAIVKLTLAFSEAAKVLDLCERNNVTAASLFPDYYGAAQATLLQFARNRLATDSSGKEILATLLPAPIPGNE